MTSRQPSRQASRQPTPGVPEEEEETYTVPLPPERTFERQAWDQLVVGEWNVRPNEPAELTKSGLERWETFRDKYVAEEKQKLALAAARRGKTTNAYLDQFEILKSVTKTTDDTAYYLLTRGISSNVLNRLYGSKEKVPETYKELVPAIRAFGQNIDIIHGLRQSVTNPERRQSAFADMRVHSGVIHGGSGKPMEIDKVTGVCYNCGKEGHFSNKCKQPKKSAPDKT